MIISLDNGKSMEISNIYMNDILKEIENNSKIYISKDKEVVINISKICSIQKKKVERLQPKKDYSSEDIFRKDYCGGDNIFEKDYV